MKGGRLLFALEKLSLFLACGNRCLVKGGHCHGQSCQRSQGGKSPDLGRGTDLEQGFRGCRGLVEVACHALPRQLRCSPQRPQRAGPQVRRTGKGRAKCKAHTSHFHFSVGWGVGWSDRWGRTIGSWPLHPEIQEIAPPSPEPGRWHPPRHIPGAMAADCVNRSGVPSMALLTGHGGP